MSQKNNEAPLPIQERSKRVLDILITFFKFGCFTFGGGWSVIAQIQKEYVEKKQWITAEDLMDFTSVGRSMPGLMVTNTSFLFGYFTAGLPGGIAAILGMCSPAIFIMLIVTFIYSRIRNNVYVSNAMIGVGAAVVPIIFSVIGKMIKSALKDVFCVAIMLTAMCLCLFTNISNFLIVISAGVVGLILTGLRGKE